MPLLLLPEDLCVPWSVVLAASPPAVARVNSDAPTLAEELRDVVLESAEAVRAGDKPRALAALAKGASALSAGKARAS
jgi:hypothetical protein